MFAEPVDVNDLKIVKRKITKTKYYKIKPDGCKYTALINSRHAREILQKNYYRKCIVKIHRDLTASITFNNGYTTKMSKEEVARYIAVLIS